MAIGYFRRTTENQLRRLERRERDNATSYSNKQWVKASAAWIKQYPFCVLCWAQGRINQGAEDFAVTTQRNLVVDHITPHRGNVELFWDQENWQTLCRKPCHDGVKSSHERRGLSTEQWWEYIRTQIAEHGNESTKALMSMMPEHVLAAVVGQRPGGA